MKKTLLLVILAMPGLPLWAGGLMTNTNYHIAFDRMFARGATFDIDAAYSNPAGLAWGHEGWQLSFNWQSPHQDRDITTTFPLIDTPDHTHKYRGKASAPFVPGLFAAYRHDAWAVSAMVGIVGSGGFVKYDDGVPMFTAPIMATLAANGVPTAAYELDASMKGKQYVYGGQVNFTYRLTPCVAAAVGLRANYYSGYYRGHVFATLRQPAVQLVGLQLDCDQRGWGFNPLVSVDYHKERLTLSARYEFRSKLNIPNTTNQLEARIIDAASLATGVPQYLPTAAVMQQFGDRVAPYQDGAKTRYDLPSLLALAAGYEFSPRFRAAVEYHFFDDKHAHMSGERQKALTHGTNELLLGAEYDVNQMFTVSCGGQRTDYGLSPSYQSHASFACDSYSLGLGGAVRFNDHLRLNLSYFMTLYSDDTQSSADYQHTTLPGTDTFSRTNRVLGVGVDYRF